MGLNFPKAQTCLIQENKLAFREAVKIAISEESAGSSCKEIDSLQHTHTNILSQAEAVNLVQAKNKQDNKFLLEMWTDKPYI